MPIKFDPNQFKDLDSALRHHIELINMVLEAANMNMFEWDFSTNAVLDFGHANSLSVSRDNPLEGHIDNFFDNLIPEDRDRIRKKIQDAVNRGIDYEAEFRVKSPETGKIEWVSARARVFRRSNGDPWKMVGIWSYVTSRKKAESIAYQQHVTLTRIARLHSMGEMATSLAHELTQPLFVINTYVNGCIQRLQQPDFNKQEIVDALNKVVEHVNLAGNIIHGMKRSLDQTESKIEQHSLHEVIRESVKMFEGQIGRHALEIKLNLNPEDLLVEIDKVQMTQVLLNLMNNSSEAMVDHGNAFPTITIETDIVDGQSARLRVCDNGPGIDMQYMENLFVPCYSTKSSGMGMGLAICRSIIEFHGGSLTAFNLPTGGACFQLTLKLGKTIG